MRSRSKNILVKGRDLVSGIPKTIDIRSDEIRQALKDSVKRILEVVKDALESTPPELSSDIIDRGILVAGGGAQLRGLDQVIREKTNVPCNVVEELLFQLRGERKSSTVSCRVLPYSVLQGVALQP